MSLPVNVRLLGAVLVIAVAAPGAAGYIHFPPATLQKMCKASTHIRVLSLKKHNKEKGVLLFEVVETLKGPKSATRSFTHAIRKSAPGARPILDWAQDRKRAVMFWIEGSGIACGYVFIDDYCYSVDYNKRGDYWLMIRAEPALSGCYHGPAGRLQQLTKDVLAGKDVKVPVRPAGPPSKAEREKRADEVTGVLKTNRK